MSETKEISEKKLLLLHLLNSMQIPLTNLQITRIVVEQGLMSYFELQPFLYELVEDGFLTLTQKPHGKYYSISEAGAEALQAFKKRILNSVRQNIDELAASSRAALKAEQEFTADYEKTGSADYTVFCRVIEHERVIYEMSLSVPTQAQAEAICRNWPQKATTLYQQALESLLE